MARLVALASNIVDLLVPRRVLPSLTTWQANKNTACGWHTHPEGQTGHVNLAVGSYTGGELEVEEDIFKLEDEILVFPGTKPHRVLPADGDASHPGRVHVRALAADRRGGADTFGGAIGRAVGLGSGSGLGPASGSGPGPGPGPASGSGVGSDAISAARSGAAPTL